MSLASRKRSRNNAEDYKIAIFCVLDVELAAVQGMLDAIHDDIPTSRGHYAYILGEVHQHNVVIAILPATGNNDSGVVAVQLRTDFSALEYGLLVGVGGGVPGKEGKNDVRLGDVVVSEASSASPAVVQFDRGKKHAKDEFELTGSVNKPPPLLTAMVKKLKAQFEQQGNQITCLVSDMLRRHPGMRTKYSCPGPQNDQLFSSDYVHQGIGDTCQPCDSSYVVKRLPPPQPHVNIHYGTIGSSNAVLRDAQERDRLAERLNILCVEMEAAGLADHLPSLVIKGVCDYADSHKNKAWQPYAAATAAAYAKEILRIVPGTECTISSQSLTDDPPSYSSFNLVNIQSSSSSTDGNLRLLLESLTFDRMDARLRNISQALAQTCKWLSSHQQFRDWKDRDKADEHHGFLWIKGKPGSGKSTIMKTLLTWERKSRIGQDVVSYFFNARAHRTLEKSTLGLYRSLTHQLLLACPHLHAEFLTQFSSKETDGTVEDWTSCELQEFWTSIVQHHLHRPLVILIDALDEGDEGDIRQLVAFLEDLGSTAHSFNVPLRICLSSRHYPHITIRRGVSLTLEHQLGHDEDIKKYVSQKLTDDQSGAMEDVRHQLCQKSAGVFLWIVLVVPILNEAYDRGHNVSAASMLHCLHDIPLELDDLFTRILARGTENLEDCLTLLQWVLFAAQPLTLNELYIAVGISSESPRFDDKNRDAKRILRCLLDTSKGLTEISKSEPHVVQFIHETVRDFLKNRGLSQINSNLASNIEGSSHDRLRRSCLLYIKKCSLDIPNSQSMTKEQCEQQKAEILSTFPLSEYASRYMFHHSDIAHGKGASQNGFLTELQDDSMKKYWIRVRNIFRPYKTQRYTPGVPLLYVMAENGLENLTRLLLDEKAVDYASSERYGTALQAACVSGHETVARLLIAAGSEVNEVSGEHEQALFAAMHAKNYSIVQLLAESGAKSPTKLVEGRLFRAIARGDLLAVEYLLKSGASVDCQHTRGQTPLTYACTKNGKSAVSIIECLLKEGADPEVFDATFRNALSSAVQSNNEAIIRLLVERGASLGDLRVLADCLVRGGFEQIIRLLLETESYAKVRFVIYKTTLAAAIRQFDPAYVSLLFDYGANFSADVQREIHTKVLSVAIYCGDERTLKWLLDHGADVNAGCGGYSNALLFALKTVPNPGVVKLLLPLITDVNAGDDFGIPLHVAVDRGNLQAVRLLIASGADVNAPICNDCSEPGIDNVLHDHSKSPKTALGIAVRADNEEITKELIQAGADVSREGGVRDLIALSYEEGHYDMAHLLQRLPLHDRTGEFK